jgi:outer membrane protein assembly factor BamB
LRLTLPAIAATLLSGNAQADDWPQWRGPERNGISRETGLLKQWPSGGPKLLWQVRDIGSGYSTPSVVGERIYLLSNEGMEREFAQTLAAANGSRIWATRLGNVGPNEGPQYPGARSTPTVDGDLLYVLGSDGDLACLEAATGAVRWKKNLRSDFDGKPGRWAYAESPLIDGDVLVCTPGGTSATLVALNKKNGEVIWKSAVPGGDAAAYASVMVTEAGGVKQYVQFLGDGVVGVDAKSGKLLWRYDRTAEGSPANIPTPVVRDGYVYSGASRSGGGLIRLKSTSSGFDVEQIYLDRNLPTAIGGAILLGDHLYGASGPALLCVEFLHGKVKWEERGIGASSLCYADGHLYLHGENGDVALLEATPEAYREKGRFTPPNQPDRGDARAWVYPVVAHGRLYIRDQGSLWCYDISG